MVKIPLAKNSLAIDHRAPQTDHNVSHEANPEAGVNHTEHREPGCKHGAGLGSRVPHGVGSTPAACLGLCHISTLVSPLPHCSFWLLSINQKPSSFSL